VNPLRSFLYGDTPCQRKIAAQSMDDAVFDMEWVDFNSTFQFAHIGPCEFFGRLAA
jgi:hypothetical protein